MCCACFVHSALLTASSESWATKGKFPPSLKLLLGEVALKAIVLGDYDDGFFTVVPRLLPYNKSTMAVWWSPSHKPRIFMPTRRN